MTVLCGGAVTSALVTKQAAPSDAASGDVATDVDSTSVRSRVRRPQWWLATVALVAVAAFALTRGSSSPPSTNTGAVTSIVDKAINKAVDDLQSAPARSAQVYNTIIPSIVVIQSERTGNNGSGLGTGVIINNQGSILTALHVVENATSLKVSFVDGTESPATIESTDPDNDIAVITTERGPQVIVPAVLGGGLHVGDDAFVVGHPLGFVASMSAGVISGLDRSTPRANGTEMTGLIQFDAAVNPGNSGGPLLNRNGQVVGIVTALANPSRDGYFIGIGFAVPIGTAGGAAGAPRK
jgi:S1-C subfamily serine protease